MCRPICASGLAPGIAAVLLWCFTGVCFAAGSRLMGPMPYTTAICLVGLVTGMVVERARGRKVAELFRMELRVWIAGFFGVSVYTVMLVLAVGLASEADVAQVVLVNYLWPLMILVFTTLLPSPDGSHRQVPLPTMALAGLLGFGGVALARGPQALVRPPQDLLPHGLALTAAALWALYSTLLRRWRIPEERNGSTAQWAWCAGLAALVGWVRGEWTAMPAVGWPAALWALFCGIGPVGLAYHWWEVGIKRGPVRTIAMLSFFIPIGSAVLMGAVFREALSPFLLPGAVMIAAASALVHRGSGTSGAVLESAT